MPKISIVESFTIAIVSGIEKVWIRVGERGDTKIFRRLFCLTVPKSSVGESFTVAIVSGIEKIWLRREKCQDFPSKIYLVFQSRKFFL